jgi:hypothetical protein
MINSTFSNELLSLEKITRRVFILYIFPVTISTYIIY